jgi:arylsulfatase/arylsulfatase A
MHRKTQRILAALCILALTTAAPCVAADRPNVVLIMTDDQGIGDFGCLGNPVMETPNIDAMATRSASMSTFYVSPVCSPTRACLMTGRYNYRTRCIDTWLGRSMMDPAEITVAEVLAEAGYATGIFGKWHLGDCYPMRPLDQGFEQSLVLRGGGLAQPADPPENERRYTNPVLFRNGKKVQTDGYCTDVYFDAALEFIEQTHRSERNFFVYLPTNAPHGPFHDVPEDLRKHYMEKQDELLKIGLSDLKTNRLKAEIDKLARIAAMITNIDTNVGRLFEKLESLQLTENTVVIFMVDNGPNSRRYVGKMRGMKTNVYEGGVRSPLWVQWPARLQAGYARGELSAHIDIMPTILDACQAKVPPGLNLDGRSLLPVLLGESVDWSDRSVVIQSHRGNQPVRYGNFMIRSGQWKLLHASGFGKERFTGDALFELYNLNNDPLESQNLIQDEPKVAARLRRTYDAWFDDVSSTRHNNYAPPRIHVGTKHENPTVLTRQDWRGGTWGKNSTGFWELRAEPGMYDIQCLFDPNNTDETAQLTFGTQVNKVNVTAGSSSCRFRNIRDDGGETRLHAVLKSEKSRGVYQVIVTRKK